MKVILSEKIARIIKARAKLERVLKVKISNRGKEITIVGKPEDEYIAEKVIDAMNFGFSFNHAIEISEQDFLYEILNIKDYTTRRDMERIRGRLIGTGGKTLKTLSDLTDCHVEIKGNEIALIGPPETIENAREGIISIVKGSKQANVYSHIERMKPEPLLDLGLKDKDLKL
jgi:ribosomal RNA assembly protein